MTREEIDELDRRLAALVRLAGGLRDEAFLKLMDEYERLLAWLYAQQDRAVC